MMSPSRLKTLKRSPEEVSPDLDVMGYHIAFSKRTHVMGILNVTPDSFSDGGKFFNKQAAIDHAIKMVQDGADIIDVGGESTRPGAIELGVDEEIDRVAPVIEAMRKVVKVPISIDTRKSKVARAAVRAGASIVNDVSGLRFDPEMAGTVAECKAALIIMHSKGTPETMQVSPSYEDVVTEIIASLKVSIGMAEAKGIESDMIIIDPGIGFGKTTEHNLQILNRLDEFQVLSKTVCIGVSRKSFIGKVLNLGNTEDRLAGSLASSVIAIMKGARLIRAHDVKPTAEASRIADKILTEKAL